MKPTATKRTDKYLKAGPVTSRVLLCLTIFLSLRQVTGQGASAEEVLTNEKVVEMVQAHLGADLIVEKFAVALAVTRLTLAASSN